MNKDTVVGRVWAMHILVPDGEGGMFSEPQGRFPVFFGDLEPSIQRLILKGLQSRAHGLSGTLRDAGTASPA